MQRNNYLSKHQLLTILLLCVMSLGIISGAYIHEVEELLQEQVELMLQEVTLQGVERIEERLDEEFVLIDSLARGLLQSGESNLQEKVQNLEVIKKVRKLENIGVALADGTCMLVEEQPFDISGKEYFERAMQGESVISNLVSSQVDGEKIIVYAVPIVEEGQVEAVLIATYDAEYLIGKVMVDFFQGEGVLYVLEAEGEIQYSTEPLSTAFIEDHRKWHELYDKKNIKKDFNTNLCQGYVESLNKTYYSIEHIRNKEGWHLLYVVPEEVIASNVGITLQTMGQIAMWTILVFTATIAYILIVGARNKRKVYKLAYVSEETGLYNRNRFLEEARYRLDKEKQEYAVICFDVDNFRVYNEIFGEAFGEQLISKIAMKLKKRLSRPDVLYAHISQDYFAILVPSGERKVVLQLVEFLEQRLEKIQIDQYPYVHIILSVGVYILPPGSADIVGALNKANLAKQKARGYLDVRHRFFDERECELIKEDRQIEGALLNAIENKELSVHYQPKFESRTGKMAGAEALIRWEHPLYGSISPARFIPVAEANGSVVEITKFVLQQVCKDIRSWQEQGLKVVPIAINFSQVEMYNPHILDYIKNCLKAYGINPAYLEIEITERVAIEDLNQAKKMILAFRRLGMKVSMDDFGTGYSGAGYMKTLPFDTIKLDKVLIDGIDKDEKSKQLLLGLVNVIKSLDLMIVAEGVENTTQLQYIQEMGVDYIQGYVFEKPLTRAVFEEKMR